MKLSNDLENMAVRNSLLHTQRMAEFQRDSEDRKAGLRWWHDLTIPATFIGLALAVVALIAVAAWWLAGLLA